MNSSCSHRAYPRRNFARWPAAQALTANQLPPHDDSRPCRPLHQAVRIALVPASIGDFTTGQTMVPFSRIPLLHALIGVRFCGSLGLRPLAPLPSRANPNQSNSADELGLALPFLPSSPSPKPRLRAERFGGFTSAFPAILSSSDPSGLAPFPPGYGHLPPSFAPVHRFPKPEKRIRTARTFDYPAFAHKGASLPVCLFPKRLPVILSRRLRHPRRLPMFPAGRCSHTLHSRNLLPSAFSNSLAYPCETPVSGGVFNPSPASGWPSLSHPTGNFPVQV